MFVKKKGEGGEKKKRRKRKTKTVWGDEIDANFVRLRVRLLVELV